jgi:hypothetical protein
MHGWRLIRYLLCPVFLLGAAAGCETFQGCRTVTVLVRDAETKKPISEADVSIWYPLRTVGFFPPPECGGETDASGIVHLRAAPYGDAGIMVTSNAKGFMSKQMNVSVETIREIEPDHLFGKTAHPVNITVELYAEPRPTVELVVPNGYRGVVSVTLRIKEDAPCAPGQRSFPGQVSLSGAAEVEVPPLFRHAKPNYNGHYVDGTSLSRDAAPDQVGLRWLRCQVPVEYFVVGTQADLDRWRAMVQPQGGAESRTSSDRPSSGGGRHHKGQRSLDN